MLLFRPGGLGGDDAGNDENGDPLEPSEQHDFVIIDGQTYTREKRGKEMVNVIAFSFTVLEIKRILAFNDRSQPPHYTIVCAIKLNPAAPIPVARLKLGEDMAAVNEARVQVLEVETDIVLSTISTQASLNAMLSKFHPRLVCHRRDGSAFVSLIMQQVAIVGILAAAQSLVILTAGIDLSVGSLLALAGLVGITSACSVVDPWASLLIGAIAAFAYQGGRVLLLQLPSASPAPRHALQGARCGVLLL